MHVTINVKSPNNISEWQMEFNSPFKGLMLLSLKFRNVKATHSRCVLRKSKGQNKSSQIQQYI